MPESVEIMIKNVQEGLARKSALLEELKNSGVLAEIDKVAQEKWEGCESVVDDLGGENHRWIEICVVPPFLPPYAYNVAHVLIRYSTEGDSIIKIIGNQTTFEGSIRGLNEEEFLTLRESLRDAFTAPRKLTLSANS